MRIEKGMLDNCCNLAAKSAFILGKDHLRHNMLSGRVAYLRFHVKQRARYEAPYFWGCCCSAVCRPLTRLSSLLSRIISSLFLLFLIFF